MRHEEIYKYVHEFPRYIPEKPAEGSICGSSKSCMYACMFAL
jgi:hypothetical protein